MKNKRKNPPANYHKLSFIIMAVFLVEIIGLVQAIFSAESIKFELEHKLEMDAVQILRQFRSAYNMTEDIQGYLSQFSQKQIDDALIRNFKQTENAIKAVPRQGYMKSYSVDQFRVIVRMNDNSSKTMIKQRFNVSVEDIKPYKIMDYETKQNGVVVKSSRTLIGLTNDQKYFMELEYDETALNMELQKAQRSLSDILSKAYYFNEKSGNFYIFSEGGKVLYQGGFEKNADYFQQVDLNSNIKLFELIKANPQIAIRVIYDAGGATKRSMLYAEQDVSTGAYFVYEANLKERFKNIDHVYQLIWVIGVSLLLLTFWVIYWIWSKSRLIKD